MALTTNTPAIFASPLSTGTGSPLSGCSSGRLYSSGLAFSNDDSMSADSNPREIIPGGNFMLWMDLLAAPFIWLCQFELNYALVPWACKGGHALLLRLAWIPFFLLICGVGLLSLRDW